MKKIAVAFSFLFFIVFTTFSQVDTLTEFFTGSTDLFRADKTHPYDSGYVTGNNAYNDVAKMQLFDANTGLLFEGQITSVLVGIPKKVDSGGSFKIAIWNNDNGTPSTSLIERIIPIASLDTTNWKTAELTGVYNCKVDFDPPIMIPSNTSFWAGVILPVTVGDTIAVLHTAQNSFPLSITNSGEFWADYTFHSFGDPTNWNDEIALAVFPVVFFSDAGLKAMPKVTTSIYPNPADEVLNIEFNTTVKTVEIITLDGKIVTSKNTDKSTASIDVRSLTSGIYWCRITAVSGEITTHKFVKK